MKQKILIIIVALALVGLFVSIRKQEWKSYVDTTDVVVESHTNKEIARISKSALIQFIEDQYSEIDFTNQLYAPEVLAHIADTHTKKVIVFVQVAELSGVTGNAGGGIVVYDVQDMSLAFMDDFFGNSKIIQDTLKIQKNGIVIFDQLIEQGPCCMIGFESVINLQDISQSINIQGGIRIDLSDSLSEYLKRHSLNYDTLSLSESIGNYKWISNDTVQFERTVWHSINDTFPKETWRFNTKTNVYSLIGENEKPIHN